tara:strand:+ start:251 stop:673 length:423 start_codon:yes stop_codon:yes gene_type:complete
MSSKYLIKYEKYHDIRGFMSPLFEKQIISNENLCIKYSSSLQGVVRGFHWQKPPFLQEKQVFILSGEIEDIICPIENDELIVSKMVRNRIKAEENLSVKIPTNYAHAYKSISQNTLILYICHGLYNKEFELTIKADKFFK